MSVSRSNLEGSSRTRVSLLTTNVSRKAGTVRDRTLTPRAQLRQLANLGPARATALHAGHNVMMSQPANLARLLDEIAAEEDAV